VDAKQLLDGLKHFGFSLTVTALGTIEVSPASQLTEVDRAIIRAHKTELVALLTAGSPPPPPPARCAECGNTRHWRTVDGQEVCALCDEANGGRDIIGPRFLAALRWRGDQ
jgi:hypothetical protein